MVSLDLLKPATLIKVTFLYGCFSSFLNFTNGNKSSKASYMFNDMFFLSGQKLEPCQVTNIERFAKIVNAKRGQGDSLSASFISCINLLNAPFSSCLRNSSRTHFFLFLSSFFFILNKTASCKNKISSSSERT